MFRRTYNRNVRTDSFGDGRRIDIHVDDLRGRTELVCTVGYTVIKARTDVQDHICMVHHHVRFVGTVHTQHTNVVLITTCQRTQRHQGVGGWYVGQVNQLTQLFGCLTQ